MKLAQTSVAVVGKEVTAEGGAQLPDEAATDVCEVLTETAVNGRLSNPNVNVRTIDRGMR